MKRIKQEQHIEIEEKSQQLKFSILRSLHFHIGIIRHLGEILHQEINILLDSPDGSFQCSIVDSVDSFLRSRAVLRVQNLVHDLLAVRKIGSGKEVH